MSSTEEINSGLCLKVMEGSHQQEMHALTRATIAIGRATPETPYSPAYLTFPEPTLSRLHAELQWNPNTRSFYAHHKSQTNPTLINGRKLTGSVELSPGDTLALGRLVVVLDVAQKSANKTEPLVAPPEEPKAQIRIEAGEHTSIVPVDRPQILLQFTDSRNTTAIAPEEESPEFRLVRLPANASNELSLRIDRDAESVTVETRVTEPAVYRRTRVPSGLLSVPMRAATPVMLLPDDFLSHQGHDIFISKSTFQGSSDSTLEGTGESHQPSPRLISDPSNGVLHFLNGGWEGATLEVPRQGSAAFELGPKSNSFVHLPPLANSPSCRFTIHDGKAQLRVSQVSDDQFVDVNGELFFTGESIAVFSGTRLLLGEFEFLWLVPALHEQYSRYQVIAPDGTHAIPKQQVRLGTAAHCEVRLQIPALAPVVGTLKFENGEFIYHHMNIALPAKIDGVETSAGLKAKVNSGTKLDLAPGVTISVEELQ
ncbi:MAG: FHA domain-containing protein [Candidatus Eremiobacteraeota bacterium]|nr:FHA domain-containing protein [Candidatus Eremiobacteraeota bacterium]